MPAASRAAAQHALRRDGRRRRPRLGQPLNLNQRSISHVLKVINVLKIYYIHVHNPVGALRDFSLNCQKCRPQRIRPLLTRLAFLREARGEANNVSA